MSNEQTPIRQLSWAALAGNFVSFPVRAAMILQRDYPLATSLRTERHHYAAKYVQGSTLDIGCGPHNLFVEEWLGGNGKGVDVFEYDGLEADHIVDMEDLPFADGTFDSVTMIATINHIPRDRRIPELREAHRALRSGGNIIVTQPNPVAGYLVHKLVHTYAHRFKTHESMDHERGMEHDEDLYMRDRDIRRLLTEAGFVDLAKHYFWSQWGFNHLITANKP